MSGLTPIHLIPYPDPTDHPSNYPALAAAAAALIDSRLPKSGGGTVSTNASGVTTIAHGLGRGPAFAAVETFSASWRCTVTARSATTLTVAITNATTGAALASGSITVTWLAV